jgi:hypothetical protein
VHPHIRFARLIYKKVLYDIFRQEDLAPGAAPVLLNQLCAGILFSADIFQEFQPQARIKNEMIV